jgi:hypothetical protein
VKSEILKTASRLVVHLVADCALQQPKQKDDNQRDADCPKDELAPVDVELVRGRIAGQNDRWVAEVKDDTDDDGQNKPDQPDVDATLLVDNSGLVTSVDHRRSAGGGNASVRIEVAQSVGPASRRNWLSGKRIHAFG